MQADAATASPLWVQASVPEAAGSLVSAELSSRLAILLARRGVENDQEAADFLRPSLDQLHDPLRLRGMRQGVDRLLLARDSAERVAVVGDYDVDGVSATALLTAVFRACRLEVVPILPERLQEGYGFQPTHVDAAVQQGCSLVVTVDCGSTAEDAVARAREIGLDVIVTDHHLGATVQLPEWVIEINPHHPDSTYPFSDLSGVGVAFKLASALAKEAGREIDPAALLRVTSLGTICDLVPLLGENRVIAALGLSAMAGSRSAGLQALMRKAGVEPPVTANDVGFRIGPRINAAGRLASPRPALDLLMTTDRALAQRLAEDLDRWNRERQGAESEVVAEAEREFESVDPLPPVLVSWSDRWHPGVLGIAAGRIARRFHRPTILMNVDGDLAKGSGRSVADIHLFEFLSQWQDDYERFGGHAQAIGLSVRTDRLAEIRDKWQSDAARSWDPSWLVKRFRYELEVPAEEITSQLVGELHQLEPFGMKNQQPILRVGPLTRIGAPRRFGKGHLTTKAAGESDAEVDLLGWGWQQREEDLEGTFEVLANLDTDRYHGGPVLRLIDARPWIDAESEESKRRERADEE